MGRGNRLIVRISESKKNKEDRLRIKQEEEEFFMSLNCHKNDECDFEVPENETEKELDNPLQPRYISKSAEGLLKGASSEDNSVKSPPNDSVVLHGSSLVKIDKEKMHGSGNKEIAMSHSIVSCTVCQKPTSNRCCVCRTHYCSTECQREDWPKHRAKCGRTTTPHEPVVSPIPADVAVDSSVLGNDSELPIAEFSDDDGFVFDCPSVDELLPVKELLKQVKEKPDLASSIIEEDSSSGKFTLPHLSKCLPQVSDAMTDKSSSENKPLFRDTIQNLVSSGKSVYRKTSPVSPPKFKGYQHANRSLQSPELSSNKFDSLAEDCYVPVKSIHSQLSLLGQSLPSIPLTSFPPPEFLAIVSLFFSPTQFNVIIPSVESKQALQRMQCVGTSIEPGRLLASQLSVGSKCGYKDKQGNFMRVTVKKVCSSENIVVEIYDFGGNLSVSVKELSKLPEEIVLIPCLTHRCSLQNIFTNDKGRSDRSVAFRVLKKQVDSKPVLIQNLSVVPNPTMKYLLCKLKNKDGITDLSEAILASPYVTVVSEQPKSSHVSSSLDLRLSCAASKVPYHLVHANTTVIIRPTAVLSPSIIWAQVIHPNLNMMDMLNRDLNKQYPPEVPPSPYVPVIGEICVAKSSQDQKYYRVEALCVNYNGMVDVRFTETGLTDMVSTSQIYHIQPMFLSLPRQARKIKLFGIAPFQSVSWSDTATVFLKDKILDRSVTVRVLSVISNELVVDMFDPDLDHQLLNNSLILLRHAQASRKDQDSKCSSNGSRSDGATLTAPSKHPRTGPKSIPNSSLTPLRSTGAKKQLFNNSDLIGSPAITRNTSRSYQDAPVSGIVAQKECKKTQSDDRCSFKVDMMHNRNRMLSVGDCVKIRMSHVDTLERFYVQLVQPGNPTVVKDILGKIKREELIPSPLQRCQAGDFCLCYHPDHHQVCRGVITACTDNMVTVVLKDYGNTVRCTGDNIFHITEELISVPFEAIFCSLNQERNPDGTKQEWDPTALSYFKEILGRGQLKMKVIDIVGLLYVVDIKVSTVDSVINVRNEMCKSGYVLQARGRVQHESTKKVTSPVNCLKEEQTNQANTSISSQDVITSNTAKTGSPKQNEVDISASKQIYPFMSTMKKLSFPKTKKSFDIVVIEVVSIQEIYVQTVTEESASYIHTISEAVSLLSQFNTFVPPSSFPPVGSLCCAKFSQDKMWYRCTIDSLCGDRASVFFVDYGNSDSVVLSDLAPCPEHCISLPLVAIKCGLAGLTSMTVQADMAIQFLKDHTTDCLLSAIVVSDCESIPQVHMKSDDMDLVEEMTKQGIISPKNSVAHPMVSDMEAMHLVTDGSMSKVLVTEVSSPSEIFLQMVTSEVSEQLGKIENGINAMLESEPQMMSFLPVVGSLCCAKFQADMLWYRVEVLQIIESSCSVLFVDYGNKETVLLSDMAPCPSKFSFFPLVAIKCSLSGLSTQFSHSKKITEYLQQCLLSNIVSISVLDNSCSIPEVEIYKDETNLFNDMSDLGLLEPPIAEDSVSLVRNIPFLPLPSVGNFKVMVSEVISPIKFFVQLGTTEVAAMLDKISNAINSKALPLRPYTHFPDVGALCCAKFSDDTLWYRAEVVQVNQDSCLVLFVDYGNSDTVSLSDMAVCPSELISLPLCAIECSLYGFLGCFPQSKEVTIYLKEFLSDVLVSARVVNDDKKKAPQLEIHKDETNLLDSMYELGLLEPDNVIYVVRNMDHVSLPNVDNFKVMVTEIVGPMEFFVQLGTTEVAAMLDNISNAINSEANPLRPYTQFPDVGSLCCAKFSGDKLWYRAEVAHVNQDSCLVSFIDFGNKDTVSLSDLAICPSEVTTLPLCAVKCSLYGFPESFVQSKKVEVYLKQYFPDVLLSAHVVSEGWNNTPQLKIYKDGTNLLDSMYELGVLEPKCLVRNVAHASLPSGCSFKVMVTEFVSPTEFFVQLGTNEVATMLDKITNAINSKVLSLRPYTQFPDVGALCCAKFSGDKLWYRAEVAHVNQDSCLVSFIDFGNKDTVSLSELAICPSELTTLPHCAVKCGLHGFPENFVESKKVTIYLKRYLTDVLISAHVISKDKKNTPQLEIHKDETSLLDSMHELGVLEPDNVICSVRDMAHVPLPSVGNFKIMVTEVVSPMELFVQLDTTEVEAMMTMITEGINSDAHSLLPLPSNPDMGSLCCAKFSDNNLWYRAEVMQVKEDSCLVLFVDYGNTSSVSLSDMAVCPSQFSSLPLVAVRSSLRGLPPTLEPTAESKQLIKQLIEDTPLSAQLVNDINGIPQLELHNSRTRFLDELIKNGIIEHLPNPVPTLVAGMKRLTLLSTSAVVVTQVVSLNEIYVQAVTPEVAQVYSKVSEGICKYFKSNPTFPFFSSPPVGSLCCAKFFEDSQWYRAEILSIECEEYTARFIDYGNSDTYTISGLSVCPSEFASLPIVAVRCGIDGLSPEMVPSMEKVVTFLNEYTDNVTGTIKIVNTVDGIPQVDLSIEDRNVVSTLIKEGLIIVPHPSAANLCMWQFPETSEQSECVLCDVVNLSEFYIHINNKEMSVLIDEIDKKILSVFADGPQKQIVPPSVGDLCLANFSEDNCWCRVRVNAVDGETCDVLYLDYMNEATVNLTDMAACPLELAHLPQLAVRCGLDGIHPDYTPTTEDISLFRKLTSDSCILSVAHTCEVEGVSQVELVKEGKDILSLLGIPRATFPLVASMKKLEFPSVETFQVLVCEVNSLCDMYVQVNNQETTTCLQAVKDELQKLNDLNPKPLFSPSVGSLCCAKFSQDGNWYRASVDKVSRGRCKVFFIDFGNSEELDLSQIACCPPNILDLPVVAIKCCLHEICKLNPLQYVYPSSALEILRNLLFGQLWNASVVQDSLTECPAIQLAEISTGTIVSAEFQKKCEVSDVFQNKYEGKGCGERSRLKCQVTEIIDPGSVYFQYILDEGITNLWLIGQLQDVYSDPSAYKDYTPVVGSYCCSQSSEDPCWYRCKVTSVDKNTVGVFLIDFGSVETVAKKRVYRLDARYTAIPPLAVHCKMNGVQPKFAGGWGKADVDKLADLCDQNYYFVEIIEREGNILSVDLLKDESSCCSVGSYLQAAGHADCTKTKSS